MNNNSDVINILNCEYRFEEIAGKGKCLIPVKQNKTTKLHIGGLYKLYGCSTCILIGNISKDSYSILPIKNNQINYRSWYDWSSLTREQMLTRLNRLLLLNNGEQITVGEYLGQYSLLNESNLSA